MTDGEKLDYIYGYLIEQSKDLKYAFGSLSGSWGDISLYNEKKCRFEMSLDLFVRDCPLKWFNGSFYFFNGKVYDVVSDTVVETAYETLLRDLGITAMMHKPLVRRESFLNKIKIRNQLHPRLDMIGFENGILDLSDPCKPNFIDFSPDVEITYYRPYRYEDDARCDRWQMFLREVLPDKTSRTVLQMFLGLGLTQRNVAFSDEWRNGSGKVELCLFLIGGGANGKSVIFEVMRALFGDSKISKIDYSTLTSEGDSGLRGRLPIRGMIFNWSSDSNPRGFSRKSNEDNIFKQLVSGEPVQVRGIGRNVEECREIPYLIFNMNSLPEINDSSDGMIRRLQIIPFDVTIPRSKRDPNLANNIIRNELPGVFNWVMRGTRELFRRKFRFPDAEGSQMAMLRTLITRQPTMAWVKTYKIRNSKDAPNENAAYIAGIDLYEVFVRFCEDNDVEESLIPSNRKFANSLLKMNFFKKRGGRGIYYELYGVTLERLKQPVFITDFRDIDGDEVDEEESFIKEND